MMAHIRGPIGTGDRFKRKVALLESKGKTNLQARRITAGAAIEKEFERRSKKAKRRGLRKSPYYSPFVTQ